MVYNTLLIFIKVESKVVSHNHLGPYKAYLMTKKKQNLIYNPPMESSSKLCILSNKANYNALCNYFYPFMNIIREAAKKVPTLVFKKNLFP